MYVGSAHYVRSAVMLRQTMQLTGPMLCWMVLNASWAVVLWTGAIALAFVDSGHGLARVVPMPVVVQRQLENAEAGGGEEPEPQVDAVHGTTQVFSLYTTVNKAP
jgi:hypothetical protein